MSKAKESFTITPVGHTINHDPNEATSPRHGILKPFPSVKDGASKTPSTKDNFTGISVGHSMTPDPNEPASPRSGILKPFPSVKGGVNKNPNPNGHLEGASRSARLSIISIPSTVDFSEFELPTSTRARCQKRLSVLLHTHVALILVCTFSILDAICVIGQLICDILMTKEKLEYYENIDNKLTDLLFLHIPHLNKSTHPAWNLAAILSVLAGNDELGPVTPPPQYDGIANVLRNYTTNNLTSEVLHSRHKRAAASKVPGHEVDHGILYDMTHTFHLASLVILSLLLLEAFLKVFAMGRKLLHHRLEIFDCFVVIVSWCLDVAFWEGIWAHPGAMAATMLAILLPWRVVRIVNSFVLVIQEKDHVQLKIIKQKQRQSVKKCKEAIEKAAIYKHEGKALAGLCRKLGANETEITACSPSGKTGRRGSIQSVLERAASLSFIASLSTSNSTPNVFDMGDLSSDEDSDNRSDARHLEGQRSQNDTIGTLACNTSVITCSAVFTLGDEGPGGVENPAFDTSSSRESTPSDSSYPPQYDDIAVSKEDDNTRL